MIIVKDESKGWMARNNQKGRQLQQTFIWSRALRPSSPEADVLLAELLRFRWCHENTDTLFNYLRVDFVLR